MSKLYSRVPLKIASIYAFIGFLWIYFSDIAIWIFTSDHTTVTTIATVKGSVYVLLSAILIYGLTQRYISQFIRSENELKASKETFLKAFTYSPLLMSISTIEDGRYIEVNNMFTQVTGFSRQETIGQTAVDLGWISAANRELLISNLHRDGRVSEMELELTAKDGRSVYCLYSGEIVTIDGKERLLSIALDITERKKADRELKVAKNHLEAMMNALPDLMFRIDREGYIYEFRSSAMELLYVQPDMFLGKKMVDVLPEEPARIIMAALAEAVVKGYHRGANYSLQMPQGIMWYELSIAAMGDPGKPETNFIMLAREITDRKVVEEAIRQSEEKFRSIVETSQEWIWETDLSWHHTYSNERVADILGYSLDEFLGFNSMQLIHQEDRLELEAKLPGLVDRKEGWRSWVLRWRHKDGSYRYLESNSEPILNGSGELVGYRGSDRDITDRKNAEEKLRENEELFSLFMSYTPVYTFIKQIEGDKSRVIQLSDNFIDMLGKPADELRGCTMDEMFPPDFARKITDDDIAVLKAGKNIQLDEELNGRSYVTIKFPI